MTPSSTSFGSLIGRRTSTILTIPTLLHRGAAEPLGLFGGRLTLGARLLAIFQSCCTVDQRLRAGHIFTMWPYNLMSLFCPGGGSSPDDPSRAHVHLMEKVE